MSGQITPELADSTAFTPRVSVVAKINSDLPGVLDMCRDYLFGVKVGAKIQRTNVGLKLVIQGHPLLIPSCLEYLGMMLKPNYDATIVWGETHAVAAQDRFDSVTIEDTLPVPPSWEKDFEEISFGGSAMTEYFKKIVKETIESMLVAKGWIPEKEFISVKRGDTRIHLDISSISSMKNLLWVIGERFETAAPIKTVYRLEDGDVVLPFDVRALREGFLYYAITLDEELPKKQTVTSTNMEEFFEKLKVDEDMSDAQVQIAREKLQEQRVRFKQLMATGDLAITDSDLKEYGILQGGLRKAILSVIQSNQ